MEITSSNPGTYPIAEWVLSAAGDRTVKFRLGMHPLHAAAHLHCYDPANDKGRRKESAT